MPRLVAGGVRFLGDIGKLLFTLLLISNRTGSAVLRTRARRLGRPTGRGSGSCQLIGLDASLVAAGVTPKPRPAGEG